MCKQVLTGLITQYSQLKTYRNKLDYDVLHVQQAQTSLIMTYYLYKQPLEHYQVVLCTCKTPQTSYIMLFAQYNIP